MTETQTPQMVQISALVNEGHPTGWRAAETETEVRQVVDAVLGTGRTIEGTSDDYGQGIALVEFRTDELEFLVSNGYFEATSALDEYQVLAEMP